MTTSEMGASATIAPQLEPREDERRHREHRRRADRREVHLARDQRDEVPARDADEDRDDAEEPARGTPPRTTAMREGGERHEEVAAVVGAGRALRRHVHRDAREAEADHHHHRADHDRREEPVDPARPEARDGEGDRRCR